ncbi:TonB-linked SusC/RagA family outer membrane protein [Arenibacter echinorum]|uniref:TonB-linked SusC/RagA family outer membrane protein n=2 Tax=Arenibacter echinorum TaxID=440515 RepID=A0A327R0L3_9FLAO|nr:TonB-linked SusC/RagA family outer membrane protein [Arenibacter echinorum]
MKNICFKGWPSPIPFKMTLKMKLTTFLLIVSLFKIQANSYSQNTKISLDYDQISINDVFKEIEGKSEFRFLYKNKEIDLGRTIAIHVKKEKIYEILNQLFKDTHIKYEVLDNRQIVLTKQPPSVIKLKDDIPIGAVIQQLTVTGNVGDGNGTPLPGANVVVKGTSNGVTADFDGNFTINLKDANAVLVISYVGFATKEINLNGQSNISVTLLEDAAGLDEVVVTALGIKRNEKALAYSVSEVGGEKFTEAREANVANALTGKIAGVNATGLATGPGGSSRVIIRGNGSLSGDNQPLYVVNGMPIDNSIPGGGSSTGGQGINVDRGDGIAGINPDDIETISVLKGGAAAALYGSRAANGVILITTKKGKVQKGIGVEYSGNVTYDTPSMFPDYQYEYGAGSNGTKPTTKDQAIEWGRLSFGAPMDGTPVIQFDGVERPYSPVYVKDNIKNFYRTGTNIVNTVALTGGVEAINFRLSLSNLEAKSVVPNSYFNRKTANLSLNSKLGEKLNVEAVAQYNLEKANNRPGTGYADDNAAWATHLVSNTVDVRNMAPGYNEDGSEILWNPVNVANNPYWVVNRYKNFDTKNRFIGQVNITYDILKNLSARGTMSKDFYYFEYVGITPSYTAFRPGGSYESLQANVSETNLLFTLNYNTKFFEKFSFSAMAGGNQQRNVNNSTAIDGQQFTIPEYYSYTNLSTLTTTPDNRRTGVNSLFGSIDIGYKELAFLTLTGREDWFSTLSPENNHIFYPSVGGSFLLSQAVVLPDVFNFVKLRSSWAQVGGGAPDPYLINQAYGIVQGGHNGRPVQEISSSLVTNPDLRPYTSTTYEVGLNAKMLEYRLGIDLTFYNRTTTDDIVQTDISTGSGYTRALLNVGKIGNKGIELLITSSPIKNEDFQWDVSYNMAYNKSEIKQLAEGLSTIQIGSGIGGGSIQNVVGRPYGTIWGYKMATNDNGDKIFDSNSGYELRSEITEIGEGVPPLTMGFTNEFSYKDFSLNILLDGKFGNSMFSNLAQYSHRFGLTKATLPGRENGLPLSGVDTAGNPYQRVVPVEELDTYYDNHKRYTDIFVYDGSFVKLREVVLSYKIPVERLSFVNLQSASISLVGRNIAILYKNTDLFDPESSYTNGNAQGLEAFGVPRTRSIGLDLNLKF